jgi:hypothetical protein
MAAYEPSGGVDSTVDQFQTLGLQPGPATASEDQRLMQLATERKDERSRRRDEKLERMERRLKARRGSVKDAFNKIVALIPALDTGGTMQCSSQQRGWELTQLSQMLRKPLSIAATVKDGELQWWSENSSEKAFGPLAECLFYDQLCEATFCPSPVDAVISIGHRWFPGEEQYADDCSRFSCTVYDRPPLAFGLYTVSFEAFYVVIEMIGIPFLSLYSTPFFLKSPQHKDAPTEIAKQMNVVSKKISFPRDKSRICDELNGIFWTAAPEQGKF